MKHVYDLFLDKTIRKNWKYSFPRDKDLILKHLKGVKAKAILDTGCADGSFLLALQKITKAKELYGIEVDEQYLKPAKKNGVTIAAHDLNNAPLPYKDNTFDLVTSIQVIEHLYFTDTYLEEIYRVLKPGGTFALSTTNLAAWHYRILLLFGIQPICLHPSQHKVWPLKGKNPKWGHKSVFTWKALKQVLELHGFNIIVGYSHTLYFLPESVSDFLCNVFPNSGTYASFIVKKPKE